MNAFEYRPGTSLLHRLDPRTKLAAVALIGLVGLAAPLAVPAGAGVLLAGVLWRAGIAPRQWIRDFKTFWVLLLFVLAARALTVPGTALVRFGPADITQEGLVEGAAICLRLWLVALAGAGVPATTSPARIEAAVRWLLCPLPFVPEKRVATMLGLVVRFLPEVLRQARRTRQAQSARCIEMRKNPVRRLSLFALALLRAVFIRAELLALAMEARCYSDNRTVPELAAGAIDAAAGGVLACLVLLSLL